MALSLHYTFSAQTLLEEVQGGNYSNIRIFAYGGMSVSPSFHADTPKYATTDGTAPWYNLSYASSLPQPSKGGHVKLNPMNTFSATCLYFGVELTDRMRATGDSEVPIGLIQSGVCASVVPGSACCPHRSLMLAVCPSLVATCSRRRDSDRSLGTASGTRAART